MVHEYLDATRDPALYEFLRYDFSELERRFDGVAATTFSNFPSFPQRYIEVLPATAQRDVSATAIIQPLKVPARAQLFTEHDLISRQFLHAATRRIARREGRREWAVSVRELSAGARSQPAAAGQRRT
jgi:hypothetical protein